MSAELFQGENLNFLDKFLLTRVIDDAMLIDNQDVPTLTPEFSQLLLSRIEQIAGKETPTLFEFFTGLKRQLDGFGSIADLKNRCVIVSGRLVFTHITQEFVNGDIPYPSCIETAAISALIAKTFYPEIQFYILPTIDLLRHYHIAYIDRDKLFYVAYGNRPQPIDEYALEKYEKIPQIHRQLAPLYQSTVIEE
jgi:hypothetical protein